MSSESTGEAQLAMHEARREHSYDGDDGRKGRSQKVSMMNAGEARTFLAGARYHVHHYHVENSTVSMSP